MGCGVTTAAIVTGVTWLSSFNPRVVIIPVFIYAAFLTVINSTLLVLVVLSTISVRALLILAVSALIGPAGFLKRYSHLRHRPKELVATSIAAVAIFFQTLLILSSIVVVDVVVVAVVVAFVVIDGVAIVVVGAQAIFFDFLPC